MTTWQRAQFWALGALADHVFFSIDPWVQKYQALVAGYAGGSSARGVQHALRTHG